MNAATLPRPFQGKGLCFPLEVTPQGRLAVSAGERKVEESIRLLLATAPGERVMRPELGCGVHDLVFASGSSATLIRTVDAVRRTLVLHEPRIDVLDITADFAEERPNLLLVRISYRVRANNAVTNMVYPFFVTEGA